MGWEDFPTLIFPQGKMGVYVQREEGKTNAHYSHMKSGLTDTCGEEGRQGGLGAGGVRGKTGELEALRAKEKGKTDRRGGGRGRGRKELHFHFLRSPVELIAEEEDDGDDDEDGGGSEEEGGGAARGRAARKK